MAKSIIVGMFREEWPAAACIPQHHPDPKAIEQAARRGLWITSIQNDSGPSPRDLFCALR
jgi:hypothetical protein